MHEGISLFGKAVKLAAVKHIDLSTLATSGQGKQKGKGKNKDSEGCSVIKDIPYEMQRNYHDKFALLI